MTLGTPKAPQTGSESELCVPWVYFGSKKMPQEELQEIRKGGVGHNVVVPGVRIIGTPDRPMVTPAPSQPQPSARPATEQPPQRQSR